MDNDNIYEVWFKPIIKLYYSLDSTYGIYKVNVSSDSPNRDKFNINDYRNEISLVGTMPELELGCTYIAYVEEETHKRFGKQYKTSSAYKKPFTTKEEVSEFLKVLLTENQVNNLFEAYPDDDIMELIKTDSINVELVKGIGQSTLEKIKTKIISNEKFINAIIELTVKYDIPYKDVVKLSNKYGSPDLLIQKIIQNPYILTEIDGYGFKKADEIALKMGIEKNSPHRITACIEFLLQQDNDEGHCWSSTKRIVSKAIKLLEIKISDVMEVIKGDQLSSEYKYDKENDRLYMVHMFVSEIGVYENIKRLLSEKQETEYDEEKVQSIIKRIEESQGFPFTEEQLNLIYMSLNESVVIMNGKAGTGKTSVIKAIVEVLRELSFAVKRDEDDEKSDQYNEHIDALITSHTKMELLEIGFHPEDLEHVKLKLQTNYITCALSGKAAQRIQESTGLNSATIHRTLGYNPQMGWVSNSDNKLPYDLIVLDECSMVNSQLFYYLIRAIESGAKLIIAGDTAQLEPIGAGNVLVDLLQEKSIPSVELTIVHRQAQRSGILSSANMVREGLLFYDEKNYKKQRIGELKDLYFYPYKNPDNILKDILNLAESYHEDILDFQVIVPMKNRGDLSTNNLNKELQKIFNKKSNDLLDTKFIKRSNYNIYEDDKVIMNGNNYNKNVFNGTIGIIEYIDTSANGGKGEIVVDFDGIGRITLINDEMRRVDLAYALTGHKTQGSQFKYTVFAMDYSSYVLLTRQLTYTVMTRAISGLFIFAELKALTHSIKTNNSIKRNTFLNEFFENDKDRAS